MNDRIWTALHNAGPAASDIAGTALHALGIATLIGVVLRACG